jgi:hypothetical protein
MVFMISDTLFLVFVSATYLAFKSHLYKYAHLKSIICSILLAFNFLFIGYGAFIVSQIPNEISKIDTKLNK